MSLEYHAAQVINALNLHGKAVCDDLAVIEKIGAMLNCKLAFGRPGLKNVAPEILTDPTAILVCDGKFTTLPPQVRCKVVFRDAPPVNLFRLLGLAQAGARAYNVWKQICIDNMGVFDPDLILIPFGWNHLAPECVTNCVAGLAEPTLDNINTALECLEMLWVDTMILHMLNTVLGNGKVLIVTHSTRAFNKIRDEAALIAKDEYQGHISLITTQSAAHTSANIDEFIRGDTKIMVVDARIQLERVPFAAATCVLAAWGNYPKRVDIERI